MENGKRNAMAKEFTLQMLFSNAMSVGLPSRHQQLSLVHAQHSCSQYRNHKKQHTLDSGIPNKQTFDTKGGLGTDLDSSQGLEYLLGVWRVKEPTLYLQGSLTLALSSLLPLINKVLFKVIYSSDIHQFW